jgi:hypothetical protein
LHRKTKCPWILYRKEVSQHSLKEFSLLLLYIITKTGRGNTFGSKRKEDPPKDK